MKKLISFAVIIVACWMIQSCAPKADQKSVVVDNGPAMKARFIALNDCFSTGKLDAIDTILAANAVDHSEDTTMHLPKGAAGLKAMIGMMREGSPDLKSEIKFMAVDGDILIVYGTTSGTNTGPMMGMPASNKAWTSDFCDVVRFGADLKMTEHWGVYDTYKMMKDMGAFDQPAVPAKKK